MIGQDYDYFCQLAHSRSGLVLNNDKTYLVQSRLEPVARKAGFATVPALLAAIRAGAPASLVKSCIDAMATHESFFFRDNAPFDQLGETILPALLAARPQGKPLRIWCAAASSGQEPYSIAMLMRENAHRLAGRNVEIIATDMSETILQKAKVGLYTDFEVQRGLTPERRNRWLRAAPGGGWEVAAELKAMITFRVHNLVDGASGMGVFDVVFCRNVLIYFDMDLKRQVLNQIVQVMAADGALFLGSAETVIGLTDAFALTPGSRGVYRPVKAQSRVA